MTKLLTQAAGSARSLPQVPTGGRVTGRDAAPIGDLPNDAAPSSRNRRAGPRTPARQLIGEVITLGPLPFTPCTLCDRQLERHPSLERAANERGRRNREPVEECRGIEPIGD